MNDSLTLALVAAVAVVIAVVQANSNTDPSGEEDQTAGWLDTALGYLDVTQYLPLTVDPVTAENNLRAFLDMIAVSEGTSGPNGYRMLVGKSLFDGYDDHPRRMIWIESIGKYSSAAGRYQILRKTWDSLVAQLGAEQLPDFSPDSQDRAAVELIRQHGALTDAMAGRFDVAVDKVRKVWASLPGAGYGQRENSLSKLRTAYINAGGVLA